MSSNRDVNRAVRSWLEEGVTVLPDRVLDAVLDQVPTIPQRRAGWLARRLQVMNTNRFRFGIAAAAIVAAAFLGLRFLPSNVGGPAEPEPTPTPTPEALRFTSERHGYSLLLPDDSWTIVERPGEWALGTAFNEESPGLDFADKTGEREPYILFNSQPVPAGIFQQEWLADYDPLIEEAFPDCPVEPLEPRTVDGEQARVNRYPCTDGVTGVEAIIFHGDRVFAVRVFDPEADESFDPRRILDEWLDGFRFTH